MLKRVLLFASAAIAASPAAAQPAPAQSGPSVEAAVSVPRAVLDRYVGCYELNGAIANVGLTADGELEAHLVGQNAGPPLRAVSANQFASDAIGARFFFEGEGPRATRIRSQYAGSEVSGNRIAGATAGACPAQVPFDTARQGDVVAALSAALRQRYIFPDVGERAASRIEAALAAGEYDSLASPAEFAARLDADVSAIAHDKHLRIGSANAPPPPPTPGVGPMPLAEAGIVRADKLAGGIGYIELIGFPPLQAFKPIIDRAMAGLRGSEALIFDVRRNGGGDPASVAYLESFLVPPDKPTHLIDIVARTPNTLDFVRNPMMSTPTPVNFAGARVFVLTSPATFSGGEGFAYNVQALQAGQIVGEATGGGANPTGSVPLGNGFAAMIPFARGESPITGTNWEGRGVQPDVAVPAAEALKIALERLGQPGVADVAAASRQQVFAPRSAPLAGAEAGLRSLVAGLASGAPDYTAMSPEHAQRIRQQLPSLQSLVQPLGEIKSVKFLAPIYLPAGDMFEATFANGTLTVGISLDADGKIIMSQVRPATGGG